MILLLLASGRGSRLEGLTKDRPKCLVKVNRMTEPEIKIDRVKLEIKGTKKQL